VGTILLFFARYIRCGLERKSDPQGKSILCSRKASWVSMDRSTLPTMWLALRTAERVATAQLAGIVAKLPVISNLRVA
jgi:hypothetical protein